MTCTIDGFGFGGPVAALMWEQPDGTGVMHAPQGSPSDTRRVNPHGRTRLEVAQETYHTSNDVALGDPHLLPGEYHERIWRNGISPGDIGPRDATMNRADLADARQRVVGFHLVQQQLADVFEVVTPTADHRNTHGEAIGQLLALAAGEVERLLHEAYVANCTPERAAQDRDRITMGHYVDLHAPMRLAEWEVRLTYYDEWPAVRPFAGWHRGGAPGWWTAYNSRKHRPKERSRANLESAIACAMAVRVLLEAEFGPAIAGLLPPAGIASLEVIERPKWANEELYFPATSLHPNGAFRPRPFLVPRPPREAQGRGNRVRRS